MGARIVLRTMVCAIGLLGAAMARAQQGTPAFESRCSVLGSLDFSGTLDAPTQLRYSKVRQRTDEAPEYCLAGGYITAQVGIKIGLPAVWSGRFIEMGCGGHCGTLPEDEQFAMRCGLALSRGYACIVSDMGHEGTGADGLWAYRNLEAQLDWGYRATHVTALAGKALLERFYHRSAAKSYFLGASTGGRQALEEAQRFPWDFDGIVAIAPPVDLAMTYLTLAWGYRSLHDATGKPLLGREELELLTDSAVAQCDMDDGVKDGVIGDPLHCRFDPATLTCRDGRTSHCLTSSQVEAVKKVYGGPLDAKGTPLSLGGPLPGSELGEWDHSPSSGWGISYLGVGGDFSYEGLMLEGLRYLFFWPQAGPGWKLADLDFDRESRRMGLMQTLYDAGNPDLRCFKSTGGRLLIFQGLNDNAVSPRRTIDYYETMERTLGGRAATQSFARLFVLPGVAHGAGGPGADTVDYLSAIEAWVEKGQAPDRLLAAHLKGSDGVAFTRPVYPYPIRATYRGSGDPNNAANFAPVRQ